MLLFWFGFGEQAGVRKHRTPAVGCDRLRAQRVVGTRETLWCWRRRSQCCLFMCLLGFAPFVMMPRPGDDQSVFAAAWAECFWTEKYHRLLGCGNGRLSRVYHILGLVFLAWRSSYRAEKQGLTGVLLLAIFRCPNHSPTTVHPGLWFQPNGEKFGKFN